MPNMQFVPDMSPYKLAQQAFGARNVLAQRSAGRKMSASALGAGMITSLPANADGIMQAVVGGQTATNLVTNGNFANGTTGWIASPAGNISSNGVECISLPTQQYSGPYQSLGDISRYRGHVIYGTALLKTDSTDNVVVFINDGLSQLAVSTTGTNVYERVSGLHTIDASTTQGYCKIQDDRTSGWTESRVKNFMLIDLTLTHPDLVATMTLEQLQAYCDVMYANYFDGTRSAQSVRVKSVGKNLFDGQLEYGSFNPSTGEKMSDPNKMRSVKYMSVAPSTAYVVKNNTTNAEMVVYEYDINHVYVKNHWGTPDAFTTDARTRYILFRCDTVNLSAQIQVEKGSTASTYEPYVETIAYVPGPLRSVGSVQDMIDVGKGRYVKNICDWATLDGSLAWGQDATSDTGWKRSFILNFLPVAGASIPYLLYKYNGANINSYASGEGAIVGASSTTLYIYALNADTGFIDGTTPTANEWKAYFYGWKMCASDGGTYVSGTKYWKKITDGTGITSTLPTASYAGYTPYKMIYQLATPITTYYKDLGQLDALPNGSIIVDPIVRGVKLPTFGTGKIVVTTTDAPIIAIESVYRIDIGADGLQSKVDVTNSFTVDSGGLGITYAGADSTKPYEYICTIDPACSTIPALTYSYPEATIQDWAIASHNYGSAAADWALTTEEAKCGILVCTNASGAANIIAPNNVGRVYFVVNNSGQTITFKSTGDTAGTTILTGNAVIVFNGGV